MSNGIFFSALEKKFKNIKQKNIVLVGGCFDILHFGHLLFLKHAKQAGDFLVVALENDAFIRKNKKREPFHTLQERVRILKEMRSVDLVIPLPALSGYEDYLTLVKTIRPSIIAVTEHDPYISQKREQALVVNAQVKIVVGRSSKHATTTILQRVSEEK